MLETLESYKTVAISDVTFWYKAAEISDLPINGGVCIKYKNLQIALFSYNRKGAYYACQNLCPHKMEMVLGRGMIGDLDGVPKVACPLHKNNFSLESGGHLNGDLPSIAVYPTRIEDGWIYIGFKEA